MKNIKTFEEYKKKKTKEKMIVLILQLSFVFSFFALWEILVRMNVLNEFLVSKPSSIYNLFIIYLKNGNIFEHIYISFLETLIGLFIGSILGILIALIFYFMPLLHKIFDPYLTILNALPKTALAPIIIIWAGANEKGIILVSLSLSLIISVISCYNFFISTDNNLIKLLKVLKANKRQILFKVIIPSNRANLLSMFKINVGLSWIGTITGEFLVSKKGIGYLLMYGGMVFRLDLVMMGIIILSIIAFLMYETFAIIERKLRMKQKKH